MYVGAKSSSMGDGNQSCGGGTKRFNVKNCGNGKKNSENFKSDEQEYSPSYVDAL